MYNCTCIRKYTTLYVCRYKINFIFGLRFPSCELNDDSSEISTMTSTDQFSKSSISGMEGGVWAISFSSHSVF